MVWVWVWGVWGGGCVHACACLSILLFGTALMSPRRAKQSHLLRLSAVVCCCCVWVGVWVYVCVGVGVGGGCVHACACLSILLFGTALMSPRRAKQPHLLRLSAVVCCCFIPLRLALMLVHLVLTFAPCTCGPRSKPSFSTPYAHYLLTAL